jgi:hypothetical protein
MRKLDVVSNDLPDPPYPADVRARGWQFQLDVERIENSDTWLLAPKDMRPWLLLLWMKCWTQAPCGSLPASDELIAARIDMEPRVFAANRDALLRGWYRCTDGRLYHPVITELVELMRDGRKKERDKKAAQRAAEKAAAAGSVPRDTQGTPEVVPPESTVSPTTGTGTGPGTGTGTGTGSGTGTQEKPSVLPGAATAAPAAAKAERGKRLPKTFKLPKRWGEWAVAEGYAESDVRTEATKFRNHWVAKSGKDATKLDWEATWQNWMLGSKAPRAGASPPGAGLNRQEALEASNKAVGARWLAEQGEPA